MAGKYEERFDELCENGPESPAYTHEEHIRRFYREADAEITCLQERNDELTAARKDDAETIAKLEAKNKRLNEAYHDQLGFRREDIEARVRTKAEVDRLREVVDHYSTFTRYLANNYPEIYNSDECMAYENIEEALTPQPADTPCEECGTVGGCGKIHAYFDIAGLINYSGEIPCPRCGA